MWAIFKRTIRDRRILLMIYCIASIGLLWMYIGLFPAFSKQSASMEEMIKSYPESFTKAFNFDIKSFTTIEGFIATEQFSFVWPLVMIFLVVGFAGAAFAGEIEKGTIEILLAQPISRAKLFLGRFLAGAFMLIVFTLISIYAALPLSKAYDISFKFSHFNTMVILAFMFAFAIYSIAILFSTIFSDKGKVFFLTGALLVAMYVVNILSSLKESIADIKYFSFFYYFNPSKALVYNEIDKWAFLVFWGVSLVCIIISAIYFIKRDIAT